ncbi:glyoxalase [Saccharothrix sp. ALI-22-I]|nr:glyoxalase [Saccharothrix sp. ALI-22-I]
MTTHHGSLNSFCWMDLKTHDVPGTAAFFSAVLGWRFAVDEDDWRRATKITAGGYRIGGVSDLANPVYPLGTPPHIAFYIAVDDVERRTEAAVANGAQLIVAPFSAGDQGRLATLIDPVGAAFSLWQAHEFSGWAFPPDLTFTPQSMVLACDQPDQARLFYRDTLGTDLGFAEFVPARGPGAPVSRWELVVGVDDPESVAALARDHGQEPATGSTYADRSSVRLSSPERLTFQARALGR